MEQKGESIHATMNDIDRKCWVIKNKQARLWKIIERYELRNVTNVDIVVPMKRVLKKTHVINFVFAKCLTNITTSLSKLNCSFCSCMLTDMII